MNQVVSRAAFLAGGGTCGDLIAEIDWSATSLGPVAAWPAALKATVANMLHTRQPMLLFWGPDLVQLYNDSFVPSFGQGKHPAAMGQHARDCWADAWPVVGEQIEAVMSRGEPAWHEDALVPIERNGRMEEVFWTYSYSPAFDDRGAVRGTLVIVTETTGRVRSARRLEGLAHLSFVLSTAMTYEAVFDALELLARRWPADIPFVVVCSGREGGRVERRAAVESAQAEAVARAAMAAQPVPPPREVALEPGPVGPVWPEPVHRALVSAIGTKGHVLVLGTSPRLPLDEGYRSYAAQIVELVASALGRIDKVNASQAIQRQRDDLLTHAPVATALMAGPDHVYQLANPLYCKLVGRDPVGKAHREAFPELLDAALPDILDRVYRTGEPVTVSEMLVALDRTGSGTVEGGYVNFSFEPLRDESERVSGMMAVAVDITDQVRARQALEKISEERGRVLLALENANRAKDEFLAMLGHELRNPLAPIVTALELMSAKDGGTQRSAERSVIERQVNHVVRLVDDLLDISKITRGVLSLERRLVDVADVLAAAIETSAPLVEQRGHRLTAELPHGVYVEGDESRLVQVVSNLLTNAAKYTPEGGALRVLAGASEGEVIIEVSDNGAGIGPELLPHVFDLFVQGERSAEREGGGLGLGLAIVKNLVTLHGGQISARSEGAGRGSSFMVRLPRAVARPEGAPAARAVSHPEVSRRVLVVDDNEDAANLLGEIVRLRGHEVTIVHDPASALAVVGELQPEIAFLDIGLPGMDGYQLAARMHARVPACCLVALTGYGQDSDRERAASAGFAAHLVKPVKIDTILQLLARGVTTAPVSAGAACPG
ncbi:MAG TPA: ATP-binding protein [Kofleriaceae bacterium]|nr:ATP-binding protein [Kofleriaceae bacterium]